MTDQHTEEIQYLRAASPELREALVQIADSFVRAQPGESLPGDHIAVRVMALLVDEPRKALGALLNGDAKPKRGRPRKAKAAEGK